MSMIYLVECRFYDESLAVCSFAEEDAAHKFLNECRKANSEFVSSCVKSNSGSPTSDGFTSINALKVSKPDIDFDQIPFGSGAKFVMYKLPFYLAAS